jgi:hypothetical protein
MCVGSRASKHGFVRYPNRRHPLTAFTVFVAALVERRDRR